MKGKSSPMPYEWKEDARRIIFPSFFVLVFCVIGISAIKYFPEGAKESVFTFCVLSLLGFSLGVFCYEYWFVRKKLYYLLARAVNNKLLMEKLIKEVIFQIRVGYFNKLIDTDYIYDAIACARIAGVPEEKVKPLQVFIEYRELERFLRGS